MVKDGVIGRKRATWGDGTAPEWIKLGPGSYVRPRGLNPSIVVERVGSHWRVYVGDNPLIGQPDFATLREAKVWVVDNEEGL